MFGPQKSLPWLNLKILQKTFTKYLNGDRFLSAIPLSDWLTSASYQKHFLQYNISDLLQYTNLAQSQQIWFHHDYAPAYILIAAREHLHRTFPRRWERKIGSVLWLVRLLDLTCRKFFLWGTKILVYGAPVSSIDEQRLRTNQKCKEIWNLRGSFTKSSNILESRISRLLWGRKEGTSISILWRFDFFLAKASLVSMYIVNKL